VIAPQSVAVTGATGFLGRHLLPLLSSRYEHITALVRQPAHPEHAWLRMLPRVSLVQGDLADSAALAQAFAGAQAVIHAAGLFRFWGDEAGFQRVNVEGTRAVLDAAQAAGVTRFVHISTFAVIGTPEPGRLLDEAHPPRPQDPYQRSKLAAEALVTAAGQEGGMQTIILRPGAFYGPYGRYAFNRLFFQDAMRGILMQMDGGRYIIPAVFVADVGAGAVAALERGEPGIYNLGGTPLSHREAFDIVCREAGIRFPRLNLPGWMGIAASHMMERAAAITRREPFYPLNLRTYVYNDWRISSDKAVAELGIRFTPFEEGARQTIAWYRAGCPPMMQS
jgi:dihydroflavonol-4-reductase